MLMKGCVGWLCLLLIGMMIELMLVTIWVWTRKPDMPAGMVNEGDMGRYGHSQHEIEDQDLLRFLFDAFFYHPHEYSDP